MIDKLLKVLLILLLIFTPVAFGSMEIWAFFLMELGILLTVVIGVVRHLIAPGPRVSSRHLAVPLILLSLFLALVLFQMAPLSSALMKILSPKAYELRKIFSVSEPRFYLSIVPFATKIEFFKWLTLISLFFFLLRWRLSENGYRDAYHLVLVITAMGVAESLYGMFEFFSGHRQILYLGESFLITAVTGTFINRNYFAGYLLMVIPLSCGFLFSREAMRPVPYHHWRVRLSSMDGKTLLIGFGVVLMILALLFSASRMGIVSLLLSFSLISLFFRDPARGGRLSRITLMMLGLAILWAAWIGLDTVLGRFLTASEDFEGRARIWRDTYRILRDFPLFGSGLGTFQQIFPMYRSFHVRGLVTHAENDLLQLASEVGWLGFGLLFLLFVLLFYRASVRILKMSRREPIRYMGAGGLVSILALTFHSLVERNVQVPANALLFTLIWALVLTITIREADRKDG